MFGHHKRKRERKQLEADKKNLTNEKKTFEKSKPAARREIQKYEEENVAERATKSAEERRKAREEGRAYAKDVLNQRPEGLSEKRKNALQYEANSMIDRGHQQADRKLLGEHSRRGIVGNSGVGYAQRRDLTRMANESRGQAQRDIEKLDEDMSLKKIAAMFNVEQGEAAQSQLDRQLALDELQLSDERRRQRAIEERNTQLFNRV